jgi:hypothetical protein
MSISPAPHRSAPGTLLDDYETYSPIFRYDLLETLDGPGASLCIETFVKSKQDPRKWDSTPPTAWPMVASFTPSCIRMFPVHTNPSAQRYLNPQLGMFSSVVYEDDSGEAIPQTVEDALRQVHSRLPLELFKDSREGFGLKKELTEVAQAISLVGKDCVLRLVEKGESRMEGGEVVVSVADMDSLRRAMNRIDRRKREGVRHAKFTTVFNELLTKLDPVRLKRSDRTEMRPLAPMPPSRSRNLNKMRRAAAEAAVTGVRASLPVLAAEKPAVLMELQAEIERVTLTEMIGKFDELLGQDLPEGKWQEFFETYKFVLSLAFARPVQLLHTQFHAQSTAVDGSGAQIGDFLLKLTGRGLAIVEIKKPGTELLSGTAYRNKQVFAPSRELGGAVTQTLIQQNALRVEWAQHFLKDKRLRESGPEAIRCVVIAGMLPEDTHQLASFEAFRNACKEVEVLTFDELLEKLKYIREQLSPPPPPAAPVEHDVPF